LVQSQHDHVHVLPALPGAWPTGSVTGLRARGDVTVDVSWRDRGAERIVLSPGKAGPLKVRSSLIAGTYQIRDDQGATVPATRTGDTLTWTAQAGRTYTITGQGPTGPCPAPAAGRALVAWDPASGTTVADASGSGRPATITGGAGYESSAP